MLKSASGLLLPVIVVALLLQILFGTPLLAPKTEMTYTEFKTALRAGQIQAVPRRFACLPDDSSVGALNIQVQPYRERMLHGKKLQAVEH